VLILGLDGVSLELIDQFAAGAGGLPSLAALRERGVSGPLRSTRPPTTLPAWTSFMTGVEPSTHGVPDFTVRLGYSVRFVGARLRAVPTLFEHLERQGLRAGVAWFPATYPPDPLRGYMISGWDSPVTAAGDTSFVHPGELATELEARFGGDHLVFDAIDEFSDDVGWHRRAAAALVRSVERRARVALWLLEHRPVDVAAFYFGEADTAAHHFWAFHDPSSPRRPASFDPALAVALRDTYRAIDRAVGALVEAAGPGAAVVVLSDHGSGGSSDLAIHLNRMLERAGLLAFSAGAASRVPAAGLLRGIGPGLVPPTLRRALFRFADGLAPTVVESRLRFGGIDWARTRVFSEELNYAPALWFNQRGREPAGVVREGDRDALARVVADLAEKVTAPDGTRLIARVIRREEVHRGPLAHLFPDLLLELERPGGYTPACLPSRGRPGEVVVRLAGKDLLGRKGRSLPGCHTDQGVLIVAGAREREHLRGTDRVASGVEVSGARLEDVAPVVVALAGEGIAAAPWFTGSPPAGLPRPAAPVAGAAGAGRGGAAGASYAPADSRVIAERLRRLGYLE
jgi:predicted AlkP superfamily phosphohydrolase/phosphomutase